MGIIHSIKGLFGGKTYYNEDGDMIGGSVEGLFGGETVYSPDGKVVAGTVENVFGGETIYVNENNSSDTLMGIKYSSRPETYIPEDTYDSGRLSDVTEEWDSI